MTQTFDGSDIGAILDDLDNILDNDEAVVDPIDRAQVGVDDNWMRLLLEEDDSDSDSDMGGYTLHALEG